MILLNVEKSQFLKGTVMKRCVIIGGGEIADPQFLKDNITDGDFVICCDAGYLHAKRSGITPHLIVGDFDSADVPDTSVETIVLPCEKDDTDSFFAAKEGLKRGFTQFLLIGVTGGRLDHTFAAISIIEFLQNADACGQIIDKTTRIRVCRDTITVNAGCRYFSVFANGFAKGVCISGAKYNLDNAEIYSRYQYGVSNEVVSDFATVTVGQGTLIVMEIF